MRGSLHVPSWHWLLIGVATVVSVSELVTSGLIQNRFHQVAVAATGPQITSAVTIDGNNNSLVFNGTNDWVQIDNPALTNVLDYGAGTGFTMLAWIKMAIVGSPTNYDGASIFQVRSDHNATQAFAVLGISDENDPDTSKFQVVGDYRSDNGQEILDGNANFLTPGSVNLNDGQWHVVAFRRTGPVFDEYIDGVKLATLTTTQTFDTVTAADQAIGTQWQGSTIFAPFPGKINDTRLYTRPLTDSEILQFSQGHLINFSQLAAWYQMNEGSGTTIHDSSGNGYTGTAQNTMTPPFITPSATWSTDSNAQNGHLNKLSLTFDAPLDPTTVSPTGDDFTVDGYTVSGATTYDNHVDLALTELADPDTGATPSVHVVGGDGGIADLSANVNSGQDFSGTTDGAIPVVSKATYEDANGDGKIDQMLMTFSEPVTSASHLAANDLTFKNVGDFTSAAFGANATDLITSDGTNAVAVPLGTASSVIDTHDDSAHLMTTTQNAFDLFDSAGNENAQLHDQTFATEADGAGPVITAAKTIDSDVNGHLDGLSADVSEDVQDSTLHAVDFSVIDGIFGTYTVSNVTDDNAGHLHLDIAPSPANDGDTGATPTLGNTGSFTDLLGNTSPAISVSAVDDARPVAVLTNPTNGGDLRPKDAPITVEFSELMDTTTLDTYGSDFSLAHSPGGVSASFATDTHGRTNMTINHAAYGTNVADTLTIFAAAKEAATGAKTLGADFTTSFTARATSSGGGGGGGGSGITSPPTSTVPPPSTTPPTPPPTVALDRNTANAFLPSDAQVDALVKLPDDGNANTTADTTVYYVGIDAKRHSFVSESIYFTWYQDFSQVHTLSATDMARIPLGTPILVRPGTAWVKVVSDPHTYYVEPGSYDLRWIEDEATAAELGGPNWNKNIIDLDPSVFTDFGMGPNINQQTLATRWPAGSLVQTPGPSDVWYITPTGRRKFADQNSFNANGFQTKYIQANNQPGWMNLPIETPISGFEDGLFTTQHL